MIVYTRKHRIPFQIDAADYEAVSRYHWSIDDKGYPKTNVGKHPDRRTVRLHTFLLGAAPDGLEWDHHDQDKLNNQRGNLRHATRTVNVRNVDLRADNTTGAKGVIWHKRDEVFEASIKVGRRKRYLGRFKSLADADAARVVAERSLWGEAYGR